MYRIGADRSQKSWPPDTTNQYWTGVTFKTVLHQPNVKIFSLKRLLGLYFYVHCSKWLETVMIISRLRRLSVWLLLCFQINLGGGGLQVSSFFFFFRGSFQTTAGFVECYQSPPPPPSSSLCYLKPRKVDNLPCVFLHNMVCLLLQRRQFFLKCKSSQINYEQTISKCNSPTQ